MKLEIDRINLNRKKRKKKINENVPNNLIADVNFRNNEVQRDDSILSSNSRQK